jgi:hypothetical protein
MSTEKIQMVARLSFLSEVPSCGENEHRTSKAHPSFRRAHRPSLIPAHHRAENVGLRVCHAHEGVGSRYEVVCVPSPFLNVALQAEPGKQWVSLRYHLPTLGLLFVFWVRSCLPVHSDSVHDCTETFFIFQEILRAKSNSSASLYCDRGPMALPN